MTLTTSTAAQTWRDTLDLLELEMPREHFNTFLRPSVGQQWEGNELVVAAASSFAISWLTLPLHVAMAEDALSRTVGMTVHILYRAMPEVILSAPPIAPADATAEIEADPDHCPNHPERYLRWRTRWGSLKRMEQKWEDEIYFCAGDDRDCTWVYSRDLGVVVAAGNAVPNTYESVLSAYKHKRAEGKA